MAIYEISTIDRRWIHPKRLPNVAIWVGQSAAVHKTHVLLGVDVGRAAVGSCERVQSVDFLDAVNRQGKHHLAGRGRRDRALGEPAP